MLTELRRCFPATFNEARPVPLSFNVAASIKQHLSVSWNDTQHFIRWWTTRPAYIAALARGGRRHTIDGTSDDVAVSRGDRQQAVEQSRLYTANIRAIR